MHRIAPTGRDTDNRALEKRLCAAAHQFCANSGLKSQEYPAPVLGLIFLRFASFATASLYGSETFWLDLHNLRQTRDLLLPRLLSSDCTLQL